MVRVGWTDAALGSATRSAVVTHILVQVNSKTHQREREGDYACDE